MKLGMQIQLTEETLRLMKQFGVEDIICGIPVCDEGHWRFDTLVEARQQVASAGMRLVGVGNMMGSPGIRSSGRTFGGARRQHAQDKVLLGLPGRDEQIDAMCQSIRNVGRAGISFINYGFTLTGVWRTNRFARARGGAHVTAFDYDLVRQAPLTEAGELDAEEIWKNAKYFLEAVVPVAEEAQVNLACHPHDPPVAVLSGIPRILGSVSGYKRYIETVPSRRHGLNFCQGTVSEMGPGVIDAIRYFGAQKKIFNVHFRNIRGTADHFAETFIDDGEVDMLAALAAYRDVSYEGPLVPDHFPHIPGDEKNWASWGFALGYMRGLLKAVAAED